MLIAPGIGWLRAERWQSRSFMAVWTCLAIHLVLIVVAILVLRDLDGSTLKRLFDWDR